MEIKGVTQCCRFLGFKDGAVNIEGEGIPRWLQALAENRRISVITLAEEKGLYIWSEDDLADQVLPGETICRDSRGRVFSAFLSPENPIPHHEYRLAERVEKAAQWFEEYAASSDENDPNMKRAKWLRKPLVEGEVA